jgi:hypothetical protein
VLPKVMTIHKAKGLEWPHVIVAHASAKALGSGATASYYNGNRRRQPLGTSSLLKTLHPNCFKLAFNTFVGGDLQARSYHYRVACWDVAC